MSELSAFADFISHFGWLAVSILIVTAWMLGFFHSDREFKASLLERDKRFDDMKADRDDWKRQASEAIHSLEQLTDVMQPAQTRRRG